MNKRVGLAAFAGYISTIVLANWLITHYGIVSVGFGLMAPAGVFAAGFAFTFRDIVQRYLGRRAVVVAICLGAALSFFVSDPGIAVASALAFLVSELLDMQVYTPLSARSFVGAVVASNFVGAFVDSAIFLWIAFGSLDLLTGQVVGKMWTTLFAIPLVWWLQRRDEVQAA